MDWALKLQGTLAEQNSRIDDAVRRDRVRLRNFIRRRVTDDGKQHTHATKAAVAVNA
jgi:hypothetical protein